MLPEHLWKATEPRAMFPVFAQVQNTVDFMVQAGPRSSLKQIFAPAYHWYRGRKGLAGIASDYYNMILAPPYRFRGVFLSLSGRVVAECHFDGAFEVGQLFCADLNRVLADRGLAPIDGSFILIASRGRNDLWNSSPGNATMRYVGDNFVAGFRTGFFARVLNPVRGKKHQGFTGVNPQVVVRGDFISGLLLMNHSSDPLYDRTVRPVTRLHRNQDEFIEAEFGEIAPFGMTERSVEDLFPEAREFLGPVNGEGFTVSSAKGSTLASFHIIRSRSGRTLALDHSRPAHTNVVDYLG